MTGIGLLAHDLVPPPVRHVDGLTGANGVAGITGVTVQPTSADNGQLQILKLVDCMPGTRFPFSGVNRHSLSRREGA